MQYQPQAVNLTLSLQKLLKVHNQILRVCSYQLTSYSLLFLTLAKIIFLLAFQWTFFESIQFIIYCENSEYMQLQGSFQNYQYQHDYDWDFQSSASSFHSNDFEMLSFHHPSSLAFSINDHLEIQQILHRFHNQDPIHHSQVSQHPVKSLIENLKSQIPKCVNPSQKIVKVKQKNKQKKVRFNSPFHNYQKHLNTALRKILVIPKSSSGSEQHQAALQLWNEFKSNKIKNKKILHFIFNETNAYTISQCELKNFGFYHIYEKYGMKTINKAKLYLSKLTVDQLDQATISQCVKAGKVTNVQNFKEYMINFRRQLQEGYLKRRIKIDKKDEK